MHQGNYFSGTSGLVLPYKNKQLYPPEFREQSRLSYYGSLFSSIEINSSFYKIPQAATVQKWADSVPQGFRFTFKLWKEITHVKELLFDEAAVTTFMERINAVQEKKGCLLVQFPPGLRFTSFAQVKMLLECIRKNDPQQEWSVSFEFRHASWYRAALYQLLDENNATLVIHDKTGYSTPLEDMDAPFIYLRFHGPDGNYRGSYEYAFLEEYAQYIKDWLMAGKDVYTYFNNTMGDAISNLQVLNKAVTRLLQE